MSAARWTPLIVGAVLGSGCTSPEDSGGDSNTGETSGPCEAAPGCLLAEELAAGLLSVRARAADDVWIVGASPDPADGTGPVLLHYDGSAWTRLDTSAWAGAELWWAWVDTDEAVFVGSQGLILELDRASGALSEVTGPDAETTLFGVWGASGDDLWATGMTEGGEGPPALWRRQGGTWAAWTDETHGPGEPGQIWFKVHGAAADDLWIVGNAGQALHWDGSALTATATDAEVETATAPLLTVDAGGAATIAVGGNGNGIVLERDGDTWRDRSPDFMPGFNGVCSGTEGGGVGVSWAVGQHGGRATRQGDGSWASDYDLGVTGITLQDWHGCAVDADGGLWTVGGRIASRPLIEGTVGYQGPGNPPDISL